MIRTTIYLLVGLVCGALLSQFPEFHQQYIQRMGGTLDELDNQVEALGGRASDADMELYQYVRRFLDNEDELIQAEGQHMLDMLSRRKRLENALEEIKNAPGYLVAVTVLIHLDRDLAQATLAEYKPALPLTVNGAFYTLAGFLIGYIGMGLLSTLLPRRELRDITDRRIR